MNDSVTFIHSGDIHLGAPFRGLRALSSSWADRLVHAIPEAFDRVIDACITNCVDFLLLAGDVFDTDKPSYAHYRHFLKGMEHLQQSGIAVYLIAGNHDPFANWRDLLQVLPENVTMFSSEEPGFALHMRDGFPLALIGARGFSNHPSGGDIARGITRQAAVAACGTDAPFAVGMLHTGLWMDPRKAPSSEDRLIASGMDYWALGHIHKRYLAPEQNPHIAFCGCIQGRDIKEQGDRGCYLVTLKEGYPNRVDFIPTASVEWEQICVDVSDCVGTSDVLASCIRSMFDVNANSRCEEMVARITLCGVTPLHTVLNNPVTLDELRNELNESYPSFFCDALIDQTRLPIDRDLLVREGLFSASVLRAGQSSQQDCDALLSYLQQEFAQRGIPLPKGIAHTAVELAASAENELLELLNGGR